MRREINAVRKRELDDHGSQSHSEINVFPTRREVAL